MAKLTGKFLHYCDEWDFDLIDETCPEWLCCNCYSDEEIKSGKEINKPNEEDQLVPMEGGVSTELMERKS